MCIPDRGKINPISLALNILADQYRFAFKENNFELKEKKKIFIICQFTCTKFKLATGNRERKISWLEGQDRENNTGITCSRFCSYKICMFFNNLGHRLQISVVGYMQKSPVLKFSNPVHFQAYITKLVRHGPPIVSNGLGRTIKLPHSFPQSLLYAVILP